MAKRTRGGTHQFLAQRVVKFFTNGRRADSAYGLSEQVGRIVRRTDVARRRAVVSTSRRAGPLAREVLASEYTIDTRHLAGKVKVYDTGDTLHVNASVRRFPLSLFDAHWGGRSTAGATVATRRGQSKTYAGAFIATGRYRGKRQPTVYTRVAGRKRVMQHGRYKGKLRETIRALRGPSTYDMLTEIERGSAAGKSGSGTYTRALRTYYVSELRRQYALEARRDG